MEDKDEKKQEETKNGESENETPPKEKTTSPITQVDEPSMTVALFVSWVIPVLILAIVSRFMADADVGTIDVKPQRSVGIQLDQDYIDSTTTTSDEPSPTPTSISDSWPTSYQKVVKEISNRRPRWKNRPDNVGTSQKQESSAPPTTTTTTTAAASEQTQRRAGPKDEARIHLTEKINALRKAHEQNPQDLFTALGFADALRFYELQFHEGGRYEMEAIEMYKKVVNLARAKRQALIDTNEPTDVSTSPTKSVSDEVTLEYSAKSPDGLLCAVYTAQGKVYYMANMFEKAVESHSKCLEIEKYYLDALNSRASAFIILGRYEEAGRDFMDVILRDQQRFFNDAFTGLARILEANESSVEEGWDPVVEILERLIPHFESQLANHPQAKMMAAGSLNRFHHVMFTYHDKKTKNYQEAWRHLTESYKHKLSVLPQWNKGFERQKVFQTTQIFKKGFWPDGIGSPTETPIFIIGFVRSGSTLLERVLDAHPMIVGTGENSVFNGRLDDIRNAIVQVSSDGTMQDLHRVVLQLSNEVVDGMRRRWEVLDANTRDEDDEEKNPQRFVDKMLTNYYNVGFIHMLYPKALILHVVRDPMDTVFSAYKHEFPPGTLDYTSDFQALSELYHSYRDVMDHWNTVLPGRVTHIRYDDMVNDMPGMARTIIEATGLPWDDSVLDFHKKKHAVNTLSTTQVRKGVYKDSIDSWKKYEKQLQPLVELIGDRVKFDLKSSLYSPPNDKDEDSKDEL